MQRGEEGVVGVGVDVAALAVELLASGLMELFPILADRAYMRQQ